MKKSISHVFKELLVRAHDGAKWIKSSFIVDPKATLPEAEIMNFIRRQASTTDALSWQHNIPHQLDDESLKAFTETDLQKYMDIEQTSYEREFKALTM